MTDQLYSPDERPADLLPLPHGALPYDHNPAVVYLASLKPSGRRSQRQALDLIAAILSNHRADCVSLPWAALRFQHTAAVRAILMEQYKPATVNRSLSALRGVLKAAWRLGLIPGEDYKRAVDLDAVSGETLPAGRELSSGEIAALMAACENDTTPAGVRDAAIIALMYACGLRREEVVVLDLEHYDPETCRLVVQGKRSKQRSAWLPNGADRAMADWLVTRGPLPGPLFMPVNKGGNIQFSSMTTQAIYKMLRKRAIDARVKPFSPHDLRRTFVSDLLDAGADIATVAKMAGHASVTTTARYDRRPEEAKRKASSLLHIPYRGRLV
jgi:site-specific recombinase XerD